MTSWIELCSAGPRYGNDLLHEAVHEYDLLEDTAPSLERWYALFGESSLKAFDEQHAHARSNLSNYLAYSLHAPSDPRVSRYAHKHNAIDGFGNAHNESIKKTWSSYNIFSLEHITVRVYHHKEGLSSVQQHIIDDLRYLSLRLYERVHDIRYDSRLENSSYQSPIERSATHNAVCEDRAESVCLFEIAADHPHSVNYRPVIKRLHHLKGTRDRAEFLANEGLLRESTANRLLDRRWREKTLSVSSGSFIEQLLLLIESERSNGNI